MTDTDDARIELDASAFLTALRFGDSFLPVGSHTASYGLEQFCNEDEIADADELRAALAGYLRRVIGPSDTVALAAAHEATRADEPERLLAADRRLHAVTTPREFRESSTAAGGQLLDLLDRTGDLSPVLAAYTAAVDDGETPGHYAVVLGAATASAGIGLDAACLLQGYAFLVDSLGAAQRLGRFGHTEIQTVLVELLPVVAELPAFTERVLAAMGSFAPRAEVMGMRHERAQRRLFVS